MIGDETEQASGKEIPMDTSERVDFAGDDPENTAKGTCTRVADDDSDDAQEK